MKAIAYGVATALLALAAPEIQSAPARNVCALLAAVAFLLFIGNVGRRPAR